MKIRKISSVLCAAGIVAGLLSGCGGEYETAFHGGAESVSGTAVNVTEQAVSGQAVNSQKEETPHRYCTDTNLYVDYCDDDVDCVLQTRLDGTQKKKLKFKDYLDLLGIREGYLYYEVDTENGGVYRAPIEKDRDGWDVVRTDQAENVIPVEEKEFIDRVWGMNSEYIFYRTSPDIDKLKDTSLVQYHIESGEKTLLEDISDDHYYIVTDSYLIGTGSKNIFVKAMKGTKWLKSSDNYEPFKCLDTAWNENFFFYTSSMTELADLSHLSTTVKKCNLTDPEEQEFISKKHLRQKAVEAERIKTNEVDVCTIMNLFLEGDRLFVQVQLNWRREGTYHVGVLMFSQGVEETELRYEKELTEYMRTYGGIRKGSWEIDDGDTKRTVVEKNMVINDSCCFGIVNGKAFLWFYDAEKKYGSVGCYELEQGTFRWLAENQSEYYELLWEEPRDGSALYWEEWRPGMPACFPIFGEDGYDGIGWAPANADESGGFYEDSED